MSRIVIGLAGGSASGKSVIAQGLVARLGERCLHIHHDRYYRDMPDEYRDGRQLQYNFDEPDALDTERLVADLDALILGSAVTLPRYDFATHRQEERGDRVEPRDILLVEGILVLANPTLRSRFTHRVYVQTPTDVRLARRMARDVVERGRTPASVQAQFERTVRPMHDAHVAPTLAYADLVVDGTREIEHNITDLIRRLPI